MAERMNVPLPIVEKRRVDNESEAESMNVIGDVAGRTAITLDDEIVTGGSLISAVEALEAMGAKAVYSSCTHHVFAGQAAERLSNTTIKELVVSDTVPIQDRQTNGNVTVPSMAPLLGEAIRRIHGGESVGALFE